MWYAMLVACATLIFVLALNVTHVVKARHWARFFRAQQQWVELMDRHDGRGGDPEEESSERLCAT